MSSTVGTHSAGHCVYVILLREEVEQVARFRKANPDRLAYMPCVYVGMTGRSPEERLQQHLEGYKASSMVRRYGIDLVPQLYQGQSPMTFAEAKEMEVALAERLRRMGYGVWQN
jgi:Uri superfamily endonuclease